MKRLDLSDRMKMYEGIETKRRMMSLLPICVRIDGRSFSKFTHDLKRPYEMGMTQCMLDTTRYLVEESNAVVGYTQSDEITLVLYADNHDTQLFFDGKVQKLVSVLASIATASFASAMVEHLPQKAGQLAMFDCRVWNVPNLQEAANVLLWREQDATRNSIQSAASALYSHAELDGKNMSEMQEMIFQKGINWNDYPAFFKRGTYFQRQKTTRTFTEEELTRIPEKHRPEPDTLRERTDIVELSLPPISKLSNRVDVLFFGEEPTLFAED